MNWRNDAQKNNEVVLDGFVVGAHAPARDIENHLKEVSKRLGRKAADMLLKDAMNAIEDDCATTAYYIVGRARWILWHQSRQAKQAK